MKRKSIAQPNALNQTEINQHEYKSALKDYKNLAHVWREKK